ncbi:putative GPI ethanolamine phosphate transferase 2-like [Capsicum annuum]|nr:putative GPI ethanolamine phosphate transferase 2-like [Capsicum annuum]
MAESIGRKREDKKREKAAPEDWEMEYSYEENMLKAYLNPDRQGCGIWEKKNRSWELQNGLVPTVEDWENGVFKYKVLKIEKVNYTVGMYNTYWMTVKVLNLTLGHSWFAKLRVLFWPAVREVEEEEKWKEKRIGEEIFKNQQGAFWGVFTDPSFAGASHDKHTSSTVAENIVDEVNVLDNANVTSTCMPILPCTRSSGNYGIEEENEVDAVDLDEDDENIGETPTVGNANIRSESVNHPPHPPRFLRARKTTSVA